MLHIRDGADLALFAPRPKEEGRHRLGLPPDAFIIGYSAQDSFFDLDAVFDGVRQLVDGGIDALMVMSGHAPPRVRRSIARFGLEPYAQLLGYLSWDKADGVRVVDSPDLTWGRLRSGWDPICALRPLSWLLRNSETYDLVHLFETRPATILPGLAMRWRSRTTVVIDWTDLLGPWR
jgi:hypothetical protein